MKLNSGYTFLFSLFVATSLSLYADYREKPGVCDQAARDLVFPVAGKADCCRRWHMDVGLLYQQPSFTDMVAGYAYTPTIEDTTPYQNQQITVLGACFDYALGLTLSLGHMIEHDNWYVGTRFDYLRATTEQTHDANGIGSLEYALNPAFDTAVFNGSGFTPASDPFTKILYSASMNIYVLDVLLSRGSYHSKCYSYEPFAGVKAVWFGTKQIINNFAPFFTDGNAAVLEEWQNNWGAGPMFGFSSQYYFFYDLSFFSDCDIAVLYGSNDSTRISTLTGVTGATIEVDQISETRENSDCQLYIPIRTVLGIQFTRYCFDDAHYLALKIGYDLRAVLAYPGYDAGFTMSGLYTNFVWNF